MARLRLSGPAEQDIASILDWSVEHFGDISRLRYEALIGTALRDIAGDPERIGSRGLPAAFGPGCRVYHLRQSADRARTLGGKVGAPRHMLVYRTVSPELVTILRVLHDAMDLKRHLSSGSDDD
jgi:toxin ParE1/3/4